MLHVKSSQRVTSSSMTGKSSPSVSPSFTASCKFHNSFSNTIVDLEKSQPEGSSPSSTMNKAFTADAFNVEAFLAQASACELYVCSRLTSSNLTFSSFDSSTKAYKKKLCRYLRVSKLYQIMTDLLPLSELDAVDFRQKTDCGSQLESSTSYAFMGYLVQKQGCQPEDMEGCSTRLSKQSCLTHLKSGQLQMAVGIRPWCIQSFTYKREGSFSKGACLCNHGFKSTQTLQPCIYVACNTANPHVRFPWESSEDHRLLVIIIQSTSMGKFRMHFLVLYP